MTAKRVLLDDVFFTLSNSGIARVWSSVLRQWSESDAMAQRDLELVVLSRSSQLEHCGFEFIRFPSYSFQFPAEDRRHLSRLAEQIQTQVFVSTYYTFAPIIPSVLLVHDCIPEALGIHDSSRGWMERRLAILHATRFVTVSESTARALRSNYPHVPDSLVCAAANGVDTSIFYPRGSDQTERFRTSHGLRNYVIMVGSRYQANGYKGGRLFSDALALGSLPDMDVVFVGGEGITDEERYAAASAGARVVRLELVDEDLAVALSGATSLIYLSDLEGFGLPPLEAVACGTPVIARERTWLREAIGPNALIVQEPIASNLATQVRLSMTDAVRKHFAEAGPEWAAGMSWDRLANALADEIQLCANSELSLAQVATRDLLHDYTDYVAAIQI